MSGDRVAVVEHQPHHIANHATTQEVSRARLIDLEQHRLLAAKVSHRRRSQHKMKIGLRSAVVVEDLPDTSEVAEIASRAEGRGRRRTVSAGRSLVSCSPEIGLDLVDERAHRLRELIAQDIGQLRSIAIRERGLLLARPVEGNLSALGDRHRASADGDIGAGRWRSSRGDVGRGHCWHNRVCDGLIESGALRSTIAEYGWNEAGELSRNGIRRLVDHRQDRSQGIGHVSPSVLLLI